MTTKTSLTACDLRTENLVEPLGLGGRVPELSWRLGDDSVPHEQTAWQIRAAASVGNLEDGPWLWNPDWVAGRSGCGHRYGGTALHSRDQVFWQVRLRDEEQNISEWSKPASFEIGLLAEADWDALWIGFPGAWAGHAVCFQVRFKAPENCQKGRVYLSGPSWSEAFLNGTRLGDSAVLQPSQSDFSKSVHYSTYDVTTLLRTGENMLAIHAGSGWFGTPVIRYRVEADGQLLTRSHMFSLPIVYRSAVYRNSIYGGEEYDARQEFNPTWMLPGGVVLPTECYAYRVSGPAGVPRGLEEEPIRPMEEIAPVSWTRLADGRYTVDFGRNFAGWCRLKVKAPTGTRIELRFAEVCHPDGSVNQKNLLADPATDVYIAAGKDAGEEFEPHFTYHGFRYVEISGLPGTPEPDTLTGVVLHTDCRKTGRFTCGNELANRIFDMIQHTEASNLFAVPTDCPQRSERMGWLNDMIARCESALYLFDASNLMTKWLRDVVEAQNPETGEVPMTAPFYRGFAIDPVCSSFVETAYLVYAFYGKRELLEGLYPNLRRWIDCMVRTCDADGIFREGGWVGDWVPPLKFNMGKISPQNFTVPLELVATALMYYAVVILEKIANALGLESEVAALQALAGRIREAFCRTYRVAPGRLEPESQSAYAYAIYCGLLTEAERPLAAARLVELFRANGYKHTTGNIGTKYLLETLGDYGYAEDAWKLIVSRDYPGWGYMLDNGATTLWERWEKAEGEGMNSHNHPMLGCPGGWLFRYPAGIRIGVETAGFDRFTLDPVFLRDLDHAEAEYASRAGMVRSAWCRENGKIVYDFTIPAGSRARVRVPRGEMREFRGGSYRLEFPDVCLTSGEVSH